ncbi:MAG: DUF2304 domain-containing protein [Rhodoferax sp.]|nr:DUF2304 domain-containing protein [Rhodoferax sp.]MDD2923804.1 DUF2304 domain-containing protein [Rhodoferax sp.]
MANLQITTSLLGLGLAFFILFLVRRDHIYISHALFWIGIAGLAALLGLWPGLIDRIASWVGISYSPAALLLGAVVVLLVKSLYSDITHTQLERQLRRLNQRMALMEVRGVSADHKSDEA